MLQYSTYMTKQAHNKSFISEVPAESRAWTCGENKIITPCPVQTQSTVIIFIFDIMALVLS